VRTLAAILGSVVVLAAGCGGDDEETTVTETTTVIQTETVPAPTTPDETTPAEPGDDEADGDAGDGGAEAPGGCGRIAFAPNTDSGASEIDAGGTDCATARAVARAASGRTGELAYEADGFRCVGQRSAEPPLAQVKWVCLGADREVVTFKTS
jgi:hypothetical protein